MRLHVSTTKGDATLHIRGSVVTIDIDGVRILDRLAPRHGGEDREALLKMHVSSLGLPNRALTRFQDHGIVTVNDLTRQTTARLLRIEGIGTSTIDAVVRTLAAHGLELAR